MIRIGLAACGAVLINLLLFALMSFMVHNSQQLPEQVESLSWVDFVAPDSKPEPRPAYRPSAPPPEPVQPRPLPRLARPQSVQPLLQSLPVPRVELDIGLQLTARPYLGDMLAPETPAAPSILSARELTPILTPAPRYPRAARLKRTEGHVVAEFTVNQEGLTQDIQIRESQPAGVFDKAATKAIRRWRFQAHRRDGRPVSVRARQRLDFRLQE